MSHVTTCTYWRFQAAWHPEGLWEREQGPLCKGRAFLICLLNPALQQCLAEGTHSNESQCHLEDWGSTPAHLQWLLAALSPWRQRTSDVKWQSPLTLVLCICFTEIHFCSTAESERPFVLYLSTSQACSVNSLTVGKWLKMSWECHTVWRVGRVNIQTFIKLLRTELNEDKLKREQHQLSLARKFKNCF